MAKEVKVTKVMMFETIKEKLKDHAEIVAFCDHEIELLSKKYVGTGNSKKAKESKENIDRMEAILAYLLEVKEPVRLMTINSEIDILKECSSQKVNALMIKLAREGKIAKRSAKGITYFVHADREAEMFGTDEEQ